ncbi:MAG: ribosome maturation factor RimP [Sciscionella sp.]|nr:ribosome maturation factor RimP [Sciscionella sp.]
MAGEDFAQRLRPVLADAVGTHGFLLDDVTVRQAGRRKLVKVVVDSENESGVGLDDIARLSREVSTALDGAPDLLAGPYTLEVTSPGIDRPLTRPRHWRRAHTRLVALRLTDGTSTKARVGAADETAVRLLIDGTVRRVDYAEIERAAVEVEFGKPPAKELAILEGQGDDQRDGRDGGQPDDRRTAERATTDGRCTDAGVAERAGEDSKEESR